MSFPMLKLSTKAAIAASEQLLATVVHLELVPEEQRIYEIVKATIADTEIAKKSLHKIRKGELTEDIGNADQELMNDYELLHMAATVVLTRGTTKHGDLVLVTDKATEAEKIITSINNHGQYIRNRSRAERLGLFASLKEELDTPEMQEAIIIAAIENDYIRVCTTYANLKALLLESITLERIKSKILCPTAAGEKLSQSLGKLYTVVHTLASIGNSDYISIATDMDKVMDQFKGLVSDRKRDSEEATTEEFTCEEAHCSDHEGHEVENSDTI